MKFALLSNALLQCGALVSALDLATARAKGLIPRNMQRRDTTRQQARAVKNVMSFTWNGGEVVGPRFASVTAEVIIPNITFPYGYNSSAWYGSSVWVGIGGDENTCDDRSKGGLIQGGYYYLYDKEGDFGVFAFYEWWPDPPVMMDNTYGIKTDIGDHVRMTVTQKDNTTGTYLWENLTQNKRFSIDLTAPANGTLCTNHAEWIIESFMSPTSPDALFPDFGELTFQKVKAVSEQGQAASLADGLILSAEPKRDSGRFLTSCENVDHETTTCKWLGYKGIFD